MHTPSTPRRADSLLSGYHPRKTAGALSAVELKTQIESALRQQSGDFDASLINVSVAPNGVATLTGTVSSWIEREEVLNVGWCAPGVGKVLDRISIRKA